MRLLSNLPLHDFSLTRGELRLPAWLAAFVCGLAWHAHGAALPENTQPLPGFLRWHRAERRVDADIQGWPVRTTLERIATATGWRVFVEPDIEGSVAARFEGRPERQALAALLAQVNFALIPSTNGPTRLLVFREDSAKATLPVAPAPGAKAAAAGTNVLGRELVVRLKAGSKAEAEALAKRLGARVVGAIPELNAYRLEFTDEAAAQRARDSLANDENVASIESNYAIGHPGQIDRLPGAGASVPPVNLRARPFNDSSSVIVALLDTGFPGAATSHADFLLPGVTIASGANQASASGELPHGEAMFETIIQGLALGQTATTGQAVRILPIDIYGGRSETSTFELAQGIFAGLERGADVLNLSLSSSSPSPVVEDALKQATAAGVIAFAASGNEPSVAPTYPAAYPNVVAVTASDRRGQIATYANRGDFVDLIAPGTSLVPAQGDTWVVQGTSVSTAYTTGLAAGLLADSGKPASTVVGQLQSKLGFAPTPVPKP